MASDWEGNEGRCAMGLAVTHRDITVLHEDAGKGLGPCELHLTVPMFSFWCGCKRKRLTWG